ncbi:class I SAM-dependent methyltransferase [Achromobacter sp. GG226]|uniref:class I SAM-dependent methyltransferase n=1 Tax=Verticiella alkaliphila TaxID=2779529 RepID=UPI001C0D1EE2|nr:class I SAM-dependent methyltransferase [Verticiella sp. GG226]MBU4609713.1 class I SAM-dependent methyltransferase [Verticiella sp. GG226]
MENDLRALHWDEYYSHLKAPSYPSQFAAFVLGELDPCWIADVGCGNGRDTIFFASQGVPAVGIDQSAAAIEVGRSRAKDLPVSFQHTDLSDVELTELFPVSSQFSHRPLVYGRFFLHAIDECEEFAFLKNCRNFLAAFGGNLALEFRTERDRDLTKITPSHFRRFVDPVQLLTRAEQFGLQPLYFIEGNGMAKYGSDDAHVARIVFNLE